MQFTNGDRFIPLRFKPENIELNAKFINNNEEKDILNTVQDIQYISCYRSAFITHFALLEPNKSV